MSCLNEKNYQQLLMSDGPIALIPEFSSSHRLNKLLPPSQPLPRLRALLMAAIKAFWTCTLVIGPTRTFPNTCHLFTTFALPQHTRIFLHSNSKSLILYLLYRDMDCTCTHYEWLNRYGEDVRIIHFIGVAKPWLQYFDTLTGIVQPPPGANHLQPLLQIWWNIFCDNVHPTLSDAMVNRPTFTYNWF